MTISVVIPAYNCESTIQATVESVLAQTVKADEILVMDDGSSDGTISALEAYAPHVTLFRQTNKGLADSRNALIAASGSDLIAFLDSDDMWHPKYLETQLCLSAQYPMAAAYFSAHVSFAENGTCDWTAFSCEGNCTNEVMSPVAFLERYAATPGPFLPSFCIVPRRVLHHMGTEPFKLRIAEDVYFCSLLALEGIPVVYSSAPLGAYRIREKSLSSNRLTLNEGEVRAFELVESRYRANSDTDLVRTFRRAFAVKRRLFAKTLMSAGKTSEAREQLRLSISSCWNPLSAAKSLGWLAASYLPPRLQPKWPETRRQWRAPAPP